MQCFLLALFEVTEDRVPGRSLSAPTAVPRGRASRAEVMSSSTLRAASRPSTTLHATLAVLLCLTAVGGMQMPNTKQEPFFIGVAGGTASGKTSVVDKVVKALRHESVVSITMDCFYRDLTDAERSRAHACQYDFDHPNAVSHSRHLNP